MKKIIFINYLVQVFSLAVNFVYSLVLVGQLGAAGYGNYTVFYNSLTFAILFLGFNLPSVIIFFIGNDKINPAKLLYSCLLFIFLATVILTFLLFQSPRLGFSSFIFPGGNNKSLWIFFFSVQFFLLLTNQSLTAFLNAHKIFIPVAVFALFSNMVLLTFWLLVRIKAVQISVSSFDMIWWINIIVNLCIVLYYFYLIKNKINLYFPKKFLGKNDLSPLRGFLIIVYFCNTLQFLNYKMDLYFINQYRDKNEVGVYALALGLSQLVWVLPNAVSGILLNYFKVDQREKAIQLAVRYGSLTFHFSLISAVLLSLIYYFALPRIYGQEFYQTFFLCLILFAGTVPFTLSIVLANLNSGIGLVKLNLYSTVFIFLLGLVLDILIIPKYGINGAAWVKVVVSIAGLVFQIIFGRILYNLPWMSLFRLVKFHSLFQFKP